MLFYSLTLLIMLLLNFNSKFRPSCFITTTPSSTNTQTIVCYINSCGRDMTSYADHSHK